MHLLGIRYEYQDHLYRAAALGMYGYCDKIKLYCIYCRKLEGINICHNYIKMIVICI